MGKHIPIIICLLAGLAGAEWVSFPAESLGIQGFRITSMAFQDDSVIWAATDGGGVLQNQNGTWEHFSRTHTPLEDDNVRVVCVAGDTAGNIWFGTNRGVSIYNSHAGTWTGYDTATGLPGNRVEAIATDSAGNKWLAMPEGIVKFNGAAFTLYNADSGVVMDNFEVLAAGPGSSIWAGGNDGLLRYNGVAWQLYDTTNGLPDTWVRDVFVTPNGQVLAATGNGVAVISGGVVVSVMNDPDSTSSNIFTAVRQDAAGFVWLGLLDGGVLRFDGTAFVRYDTLSGILGNTVYALAVNTRHERWFGTEAGLTRFSNDPPRFTSTAPATGQTNVLYQYQTAAADTNGDIRFRFRLVSGPAGLAIDSLTGQVSWTPGDADTGSVAVTVRVEDDYGAFADQPFAIQITPSVANQYAISLRYSLAQNAPNPFSGPTAIRYILAKPSPVTLAIYDIRGKLVQILEQGRLAAGAYHRSWDGRDAQNRTLASGIYFCKLTAGEFTALQKMRLIK
jgi:hypothetical protein